MHAQLTCTSFFPLFHRKPPPSPPPFHALRRALPDSLPSPPPASPTPPTSTDPTARPPMRDFVNVTSARAAMAQEGYGIDLTTSDGDCMFLSLSSLAAALLFPQQQRR